jgi:hypothetical protein
MRTTNNCITAGYPTFRLECDYRRVKGELDAEKNAHEQTRERANGDMASSRGSSSSLLSAYRSRRYSSQADMAILQEKMSIGEYGVQPSLARRTSVGYASSANILSKFYANIGVLFLQQNVSMSWKRRTVIWIERNARRAENSTT